MEQITFNRSAVLPGAEIVTVRNSTRVWKVFHEAYEVCTAFSVDGLAPFYYRRKLHMTSKKNLMLLEPGETHYNPKPVTGSFYVLYLPARQIETAAKQYGHVGTPHFNLGNVADQNIFHAFNGFHQSMEKTAPTLEITSRFEKCLSLLFNQCIEKKVRLSLPPSRRSLRQARDFIIQNCEKDMTLSDLSHATNLSRFHFLRAFSQEFGLPPHAFQTRVRVAKAQGQLAKGIPLSQINVGFADQSHLTRHFKNVYGITPGQYAKSVAPSLRRSFYV